MEMLATAVIPDVSDLPPPVLAWNNLAAYLGGLLALSDPAAARILLRAFAQDVDGR
jgi:hypothetical protein